jgi:hypothetical protein
MAIGLGFASAGCSAAAPQAAPASPTVAPAPAEPVARPSGGEAGSGTRGYALPNEEAPTTPAPDPTTPVGLGEGARPTTATGATGEWKGSSAAPPPTLGNAGDVMRLIEEEEHVMLGALDEAKRATGVTSSAGASACGRACTALGSMRRSVARLCELTASSDRRCEEAKGRLAKDEELVKQARCECSAP